MKTDLEKLNDLAFEWLAAKDLENKWANKRRSFEAEMLEIKKHNLNIEGSERIETESYVIIITNRIDRKVNADILEEIVKENDLASEAKALFRWKPEIKIKEWKQSHETITNQFKAAVSSKPGKPSFKIDIKER